MKGLLVFVLAGIVSMGGCDDSDPVDPGEPDPGEGPEQVAMSELLEGELSIELDPGGRAPLTALVRMTTTVPVEATVTVLGAESIEHTAEGARREHAVPVLGLYPGTTNLVELRLDDPGTAFALDTLEMEAAPLPDFFPDIEIREADPERMEPGLTLANLSIGTGEDFITMPILFDARGDVRWYLDLEYVGGMAYLVVPAANGNLLTAHAEVVYELDMLGREIERWEIPGWAFHHDITEKPDGNLIIAVTRVDAPTVNDHVIELDRASGEIVREWDLREVLDVHRRDFEDDERNWLHHNGTDYVEAEDALILSSRNQTAVFKVTGDNELVWIMAPHRGWGRAGEDGEGHRTSDFLLTAVDDEGVPYPEAVQLGEEGSPEFRWSWGQHMPMLLPDGNLFVFDNGFHREFGQGPTLSRGVEYVIDEADMTVRQVWQYGEQRGTEYFAPIVSNVDHLPETGNRLVAPGVGFSGDARAFVTEVTHPEGEVVFEAKISFLNARSGGALEWGDFDLVYRAHRLPLYPR